MNTSILVLLSCVIFGLTFWINISTSQFQRQRLAIIAIGIIIILAVLWAIGYYSKRLNPNPDTIFLSASLLWAHVFAYLINLRRKAIYKSKIHWAFSYYLWLAFACIIILGMMWRTTLPNLYDIASGKPILDETYYRHVFRQLSILIPILLFIILVPFQQKTVIHQNGIYQNGLFWNWSEIQEYKWVGSSLDDSIDVTSLMPEQPIIELIFTTGKTLFWKEKRIHVFVPHKDSKFLVKFLEQNIRKK